MASAWAFIEDRGELLLVRRNFDVGRGGQWCPPGGTMWRREEPAVAAVREAYEETRLRVVIRKKLGQVEQAHYFLCELRSDRGRLKLNPDECIDALWLAPRDVLDVGTIMDLRRILPILKAAGFDVPELPGGLDAVAFSS